MGCATDRRSDEQHSDHFVADRVDQGTVKAVAVAFGMPPDKSRVEDFRDTHARVLEPLRDGLSAAVRANHGHRRHDAQGPDTDL